MWGEFLLLTKKLYKVVIVFSLCIALFLVVGSQMVAKQKSINSGVEISKITDDLQVAKANISTSTVQSNKSTNQNTNQAVAQATKTLIGVNDVKLAEFTGDAQKIVVESNTWQVSADVILVQKGMRANRIFRLVKNEECYGKLQIEKLGMVIPITGKEMTINFTPWKDFIIICDQGKFNYYVKVVEKLGITDTNVKNNNNTQRTVSQKQSTKTNTSAAKAAKPVPAAKPKESITQNDNYEVPTQTPKAVINEENFIENKQAPAKEEPRNQPENKKNGILDHLFHHHH